MLMLFDFERLTNFHYLNFLMKIAVMIAVAITEITFAIIAGNPKPSGACRIYPNEIKVHTTAGANVIMYCFSFFIR